jgi:arabinan endo-1,5-alpha-L-arabinosidase
MMENHHEILIQKNSKFVGTGHNSEIVSDDKGQDWIFYHAVWVDNPQGRVLMLDKIQWMNDWPYVTDKCPSLEADKPYFKK